MSPPTRLVSSCALFTQGVGCKYKSSLRSQMTRVVFQVAMNEKKKKLNIHDRGDSACRRLVAKYQAVLLTHLEQYGWC